MRYRDDLDNEENKTESGEIVYFESMPIQNGMKSAAAGHPVFDDVPHIVSISPGVPPNVVRVVARPKHYKMYTRQWRAFLDGQRGAQIDGTPLSEWPPIGKAQLESLKYAGIHTVEQLAALHSEQQKSAGLGVDRLVQLAGKWLAQSKDGSAISSLVDSNQKLQEELEAIKRQLAEVASLPTTKRKRTEQVEVEGAVAA